MTVKELIEALEWVPADLRDKEVKVWLPGSKVRLSSSRPMNHNGVWLIEGNLEPGSALGG